MKLPKFFSFAKSSFLIFDLLFFIIAIALYAQINLAQTNVLQLPSPSTTLQASKPETKAQSGWLILTGLAGLAGLVGLAVLEHKRRNLLKKNGDSQNVSPDEDNYFG